MRKHSNPLLVELMIVILFFTLAASVLMEIFTTADSITRRTAAETTALREGQNLAEQLYAAPDADALLLNDGFTKSEGNWTKEIDDIHISVISLTQQTEVGRLKSYSVVTSEGENIILSIPVTRYLLEEVRQ